MFINSMYTQQQQTQTGDDPRAKLALDYNNSNAAGML